MVWTINREENEILILCLQYTYDVGVNIKEHMLWIFSLSVQLVAVHKVKVFFFCALLIVKTLSTKKHNKTKLKVILTLSFLKT